MDERKKIDLNTSIMDMMVILSEGNPGATTVIARMASLDPMNILLLLGLDEMNIRGWQIWCGYKNYCNSDLNMFIECVRNRDSNMIDKINNEAIRMKQDVRAVIRGASF